MPHEHIGLIYSCMYACIYEGYVCTYIQDVKRYIRIHVHIYLYMHAYTYTLYTHSAFNLGLYAFMHITHVNPYRTQTYKHAMLNVYANNHRPTTHIHPIHICMHTYMYTYNTHTCIYAYIYA